MISSIIPLFIFSLIFIVPMAKASQSENVSTSNTTVAFNEAINDSGQKDEVNIQETDDVNDSPSSSELSLSLNEKLQWFFSFDKPDFIDDPYENQDYDNYRATFGFQFAL